MKYKEHVLKIHPEYFAPVVAYKKPFEIRKNDRDYKVNDFIKLREFVPKLNKYTGNWALEQITYMTDYRQEPGYVVLGIELIYVDEPNPDKD